jgi:hypothetical protein
MSLVYANASQISLLASGDRIFPDEQNQLPKVER